MKMRCKIGLGEFVPGDEWFLDEIKSRNVPQVVIDMCFVPVEDKPKTIKLPIVHDKGFRQLGCWVQDRDYGIVFEEHSVVGAGSKRWLPLHEIPSRVAFVGWTDNDRVWSTTSHNGRVYMSSEQRAGWAKYAVFATE